MKRQISNLGRVLFLLSTMSAFLFSGFAQAEEMGSSTMHSSRMMESARTMMDGYNMMKSHMMKEGIMRADDALPGGKMMLEGYKKMTDGEKIMTHDTTTDGKEMMVAG